MKKSFSKIKGFFVIAFVSIASFVSKAMGQAIDNDWSAQQGFYGVSSPKYLYAIKEPEPSLTSTIIDIAVKCIEGLLVAAIFVIGLVGFLKIRKIEDKDLKSKKIKRTVIAIVVLLVIGILVGLGYRLYNEYAG